MSVTTRIITFLVGNPELNLHLPLESWVGGRSKVLFLVFPVFIVFDLYSQKLLNKDEHRFLLEFSPHLWKKNTLIGEMIIYSGLLIQRFPKLKLEKKIQVQPKQLKVFMKIKAG